MKTTAFPEEQIVQIPHLNWYAGVPTYFFVHRCCGWPGVLMVGCSRRQEPMMLSTAGLPMAGMCVPWKAIRTPSWMSSGVRTVRG